MKRYTKKIVFILGLVFLLASCEQLQGLLSSEMEKAVSESTGKASIASKYWYYNGTKDTDMTKSIEVGTDCYESASLLVSFGKKVALQNANPSGYIVLTYTDAEGLIATKTIPNLTGTFTEDFTGFKVSMVPVLSYFDTVTIPSGTASMEIKISGFVCAEGKQSGRALAALVHTMTIMPLFPDFEIDFSTCWYKSGDYVALPLNGEITVPEKIITTKDGSRFTLAAGKSEIKLTPIENIFGKSGSTSFILQDILPLTAGDSYEQEITVNFVKNAIVMDGKEDLNYSVERAVFTEDVAGDQNAFAELGYDVTGNADITKLSVVNDDTYLYIGVSGNLAITWNDGLVVMIAKEGQSQVTRDMYRAAEKESLKPLVAQIPFAYLYHKPGNENTGTGKWGAYTSLNDITSNCRVSPAGWTDSATGTFLEYAFPLADLGLSKDDVISVAALASLHWDDGVALCDIVPDSVLYKENLNRTEVMYDFSKGLQFTVK